MRVSVLGQNQVLLLFLAPGQRVMVAPGWCHLVVRRVLLEWLRKVPRCIIAPGRPQHFGKAFPRDPAIVMLTCCLMWFVGFIIYRAILCYVSVPLPAYR